MFKWLICLLVGHKWFIHAFFDNEGSCCYERCIRCGKYKGKGKEIVDNWLNEDADHYLVVGD